MQNSEVQWRCNSKASKFCLVIDCNCITRIILINTPHTPNTPFSWAQTLRILTLNKAPKPCCRNFLIKLIKFCLTTGGNLISAVMPYTSRQRTGIDTSMANKNWPWQASSTYGSFYNKEWSRIPLYFLPYYGGYDRYWSQSNDIQNITSLDYGKFYTPSTEYLVGTIKQKFSNLYLILSIHVFASSLLCFYSAAKQTSMPDINPECRYLSALPREFLWTIKNGKIYA